MDRWKVDEEEFVKSPSMRGANADKIFVVGSPKGLRFMNKVSEVVQMLKLLFDLFLALHTAF